MIIRVLIMLIFLVILKPVLVEAEEEKTVILTFDDGPREEITPELLKLLKAENVKATFFVVGWRAKENRELVKDIHNTGHDVENHSWSHYRLDKIPLDKAIFEVQRTHQFIYDEIGKDMLYFRPPYMAITKKLRSKLTDLGFKIVGWDIGSLDWVYDDPEKVFLQVKKEIDKRSSGRVVILFHETKWTLKTMPRIIHYLKSQGWKFETLDGGE